MAARRPAGTRPRAKRPRATTPDPTTTPTTAETSTLTYRLSEPVMSHGRQTDVLECRLPISWLHGRGMYARSYVELSDSGPSLYGLLESLFVLSAGAIQALPALDVIRLDRLIKPHVADFPGRESLITADARQLTVRFCRPGAFPSRPDGCVMTQLPIRFGAVMPMLSARPAPCFFLTIEQILENLFDLTLDDLGPADCREVSHLFSAATPFFIGNS